MKKITLFLLLFITSSVFASEPKPWQMYFQPAATEIMAEIEKVYWMMQIVITVIVAFVAILLSYTCYRFHHKRNPIPAKFTHNVTIEITWTLIPVLILCFISVPSFKLLHKEHEIPTVELTIKVTGHQWYWSYSYQDIAGSNISFDSYMIDAKKITTGQKRLLDVDNKLVIPQNTNVRFLITAADVIHSFTVPSFGFKIDAVPGRINETYVNVPKTGVYYGQCSEICGVNHGFMPIAVEVVTKDEFETWLQGAKAKFAAKNVNLARNFKILQESF
ncbi:MAG: cytochrome c oxidase subunit II [Rickettsiaceae bacterium]|nr:cytochrome c oxidase subunit II [Rickettsiaceae bacterium]